MSDLKIGGQAVVEGVTMRSNHYIATAVRKSDGTIKKRIRKFISFTDRHKAANIPFIRGIFSLVEVMILGFKEITWSSNQAIDENEKITTKEIVFMIVFSLIFGIALFKLLPWFLATTIIPLIKKQSTTVNILDALFKIIILSTYLFVISLMPDVKRLFQYHGAEHKSVTCHEKKIKLTPKNAQKFTTIHPRCGTTFIIWVFLFSMLFYMLIPISLGFWMNFLVRILLLPLIAGVSFEVIRLSGKYYYKSKIVRIIVWPGLQFQRLTTREPDLKQLEVAIASLNACLDKEKKMAKKA